MTAILGISAFYHDSAAALVVDGRIVAAAQEERFSRIKHDESFPAQAIAYCLDAAGLTTAELDYVGYYEKPFLKFERLLETQLAFALFGFAAFAAAIPHWVKQKLHLPRELRRGLPGYRRRFIFAEHHEAHAASAFFPSPFDEAAILTVDGVGEWATATWGRGRGNRITLCEEQRFPHSLGLLYSAFTSFCGFRVNSGEYKLMGLAPYGEPRFAELILRELVDLKDDGSFRLNMSYFTWCHRLTMTGARFAALFGGPPRTPEAPLTQREKDIAASIQQVTEEILLRIARHVHARTGLKQLCLAGGVALNCVANGRLLREGPFERIWIQPAAGDAGGALGVAQFIWHQLLDRPRQPLAEDSMGGSFLGPACDPQSLPGFFTAHGAVHRRIADADALCAEVAGHLAAGRIVGWVQGRMEFGPRALGARSILGDARDPTMQATINRKTKFRESFRPFAPAVLREAAGAHFAMSDDQDSPYMLLVTTVTGDMSSATNQPAFPAVTHVDGSARVQTVDAQRNPRFHRLLSAFAARTGCPLVVNTSFNVRGEPLVCTAADAYRCFMETNIDVLVIEDCLLLKAEQPARPAGAVLVPSALRPD